MQVLRILRVLYFLWGIVTKRKALSEDFLFGWPRHWPRHCAFWMHLQEPSSAPRTDVEISPVFLGCPKSDRSVNYATFVLMRPASLAMTLLPCWDGAFRDDALNSPFGDPYGPTHFYVRNGPPVNP